MTQLPEIVAGRIGGSRDRLFDGLDQPVGQSTRSKGLEGSRVDEDEALVRLPRGAREEGLKGSPRTEWAVRQDREGDSWGCLMIQTLVLEKERSLYWKGHLSVGDRDALPNRGS